LVRLLARFGRTVVGTYFGNPSPGLVQMDASDEQRVMDLFAEVRPTLVINASNAQGGTDACELDPSLAERYHFGNGRNLAEGARQHGARFVQISTDYVFDGKAGPYRETDTPSPLSQLGRAKLKLEEYVLSKVPDSLVVRTSFVFSWTPESKSKNFVMQLIDSHHSRRPMRVPSDQVGNVTYAPNFSEALLEMNQIGLTGLYHLAGTTRCSKYDWALKVADILELDAGLIQGVTTAELSQPAPRPLQSGFVLDKVQAALRRTQLISIEAGLADMKRQMAGAKVRL
jgi:dTDP-4-dehydrorhamnose reductase